MSNFQNKDKLNIVTNKTHRILEVVRDYGLTNEKSSWFSNNTLKSWKLLIHISR